MKNFIYIAMAIAAPIALVNCTKEKTIVEVQKGNTILSGTETPTATLGSIGDYYLRLPVYDFYGPKTAEGWGTPVSLKGTPGNNGAAGEAGTKIHSGNGAPAADKGNEGDWYIDTVNKRLYGPKTTAGWPTTYIGLGGNTAPSPSPTPNPTPTPNPNPDVVTPADYELSSDGKTLVEWKNKNTKNLNMQADEKLKNVTVIDIEAFNGVRLTALVLPNGLKTIKRKAFVLNGLTTLVIPNGVTTIEKEAFQNNQLTTVSLPNTLTKIAAGTFSGNKLSTITIPNSITEIGDTAFSSNQLTTVTIPSSVKTIGNSTFSNNKLTSVVISEGVEKMEYYAFSNNRLRTIILPSTLIEIKERCFSENRLETVTFVGSTPPTNGPEVFKDNSLQHIYVPAGSVVAYKAKLSEYQSYITAK